jgi:hypothetical protein
MRQRPSASSAAAAAAATALDAADGVMDGRYFGRPTLAQVLENNREWKCNTIKKQRSCCFF